MLDNVIDYYLSGSMVTPLTSAKSEVLLLELTASATVTPVIPVIPHKASYNKETQNCWRETHAAIKAFYLSHGRMETDWE
ncbi:MAG: hypothetical protein ACXW1U_16935 [Methylobacter sp.]